MRQRAPDDRDSVLRAAAAIARSARLQAQLVDDLLDIGRGSAGKMALALEELDIDEVIQASLAMVRHGADAKRMSLRYVASKSLLIRADSRRLEQVLVNLLTNAIKFTGEAGVVSVLLSRQDGHAVVRAADTGRGIPSDLLPRIFDRFWQAGQVDGQQGGLGLGLNIVRSLVELHGGSITRRVGTTWGTRAPRSHGSTRWGSEE